jgi:hypothetical protein
MWSTATMQTRPREGPGRDRTVSELPWFADDPLNRPATPVESAV